MKRISKPNRRRNPAKARTAHRAKPRPTPGSTPPAPVATTRNDTGLVIPKPFPTDLVEAVRAYKALGLAIHPLLGPEEGVEHEKGKAPRWKKERWGRLKDNEVEQYFGNGRCSNIACLLRGSHVVVDLDGKQGREVVDAWLGKHPELEKVPREKTSRGYHFHLCCPDLPVFRKKNGKKYGRALVAQLAPGLGAEFFFEGLNVTMAPSVHHTGHRYTWEVTGEIPTVTWAQIQACFGFVPPGAEDKQEGGEKRGPGRPAKEAPWWTRYQGDLATLDLLGLFKDAKLDGKLLDGGENKWSVTCPWQSEHSDGGGGNGMADTGTVVFAGKGESWPGFNCLHAHCSGRGLEQVLKFFESREPGCVDRHCRATRVWFEGKAAADGRREVQLPCLGRTVSEFAAEVGSEVAKTKRWFRHGDVVADVRQVQLSETIKFLGFNPLRSVEAVSAIEEFLDLGVVKFDKESEDFIFHRKSMDVETASKLISAPQFRDALPHIVRILDFPLPIFLDGKIVRPAIGYDPRFRSFTNSNFPNIRPLSIKAALRWLRELLDGFCFADPQSAVHAVAFLLTPYCRGLTGWDARFPLWMMVGNRPRAGKDHMAGLAGITYEGYACEDPPVSEDAEELRKKITTALRHGRRLMHFANCEGHLRNAVLKEAVTAKVWSDRILGGNVEARYPVELMFSLSGNVGRFSYDEDLATRSRRISLSYADEDPNARRFPKTDLWAFASAHRSDILCALDGLVAHWENCGCPRGKTPFTSFPQWAEVVGGIMTCAEMGDPCLPHAGESLSGGDELTEHMKELFRLCYAKHPEVWIEKKEIYAVLDENPDVSLFPWWGPLSEQSARVRLGRELNEKYRDRVLGGIRLRRHSEAGRISRAKFLFTKDHEERVNPGADHLKTALGEQSSSSNGSLGSVGRVSTQAIQNTSKTPADHENGAEGGGFPEASGNAVPKTAETTDPAIEPPPPAPPAPAAVVRGRLVASKEELAGIAEEITDLGAAVALDLETYGRERGDALDPFRGDIRLLSLAIPAHEPWLLDLKAIGYDLGPLARVLEEKEILGHNVKFDLLRLRRKCSLAPRRIFCTLTASRLLTAGTKEPNDLGTCLHRHLGVNVPKELGKSDWGAALSTEQLAYAATDVVYLHALRDRLVEDIRAAGLDRVCDLEMQLLPVVVDIEQRGFGVDREKLVTVAEEARKDAAATRAKLVEVHGAGLNPNSHPQVKAALAKAGVPVESTNAETLGTIEHTLARLVLEYRGHEKLRQQARSFLEELRLDDRIHARFEPMGTDTGRFSCREPNLQNVSRGPLRGCFIPATGSRLVVADYSQVELRVAAVIAGDAKMLEALRKSEDLHRATAAAVLGKSVAEITKEDRQLAKAVNFGLLYGQYPKGLVRYAETTYGVALSEEQATNIRERFFKTYAGLQRWHQRAWQQAKNRAGETRTAMGRRRLIPENAEEWQCFAALVNSPVQGGCADGMKSAILRLAKLLPPGAGIVSTIHDELVVEASEADAERVKDLVVTTMREAMEGLFPGVPIEVEARVCRSWGEK